MTTAPPPDLWDTPRVAQYLGMGERYVQQLVRENRIPFVRLGRSLRFHPDELRKWALERQNRPVR